MLGVGVLGVVVLGVNDGGGAGSDPSACGAGSGAGGGGAGSLSTAGAVAALVGGVGMAGTAAGADAAGGAVVGAGFAFGGPGSSVSQSTAVMDPKPARNAATHASGTTTARPPILTRKERWPASWSSASDSPSVSPGPRTAPSLSASAAASVGASSPSVLPTGSVALSMTRMTLSVVRRTGTIATVFVPHRDRPPRPRFYWRTLGHPVGKIEEHLTIYPGTSKTDIRKLGNSDAVDEALKWMIGQERLRVEKDGRAHRHFLVGDEETDE